ncbi:hypothetical protein [Roseobacter cerasinus]|uniref:hypothetical protein n=1 Tax=Roseobacter cerasinus TaxID=2602289 RepID=UPI0013575CF9|nr:hypothetical protein [Roseobacter cerasinus]
MRFAKAVMTAELLLPMILSSVFRSLFDELIKGCSTRGPVAGKGGLPEFRAIQKALDKSSDRKLAAFLKRQVSPKPV